MDDDGPDRASTGRSPEERIEEVASVVSHDLQNPLTIANGYLARARSHGDEEYFEHVADALEEIRAISDEAVALARLGQPVARTEPVDFEAFVDSCWAERNTGDATLCREALDPIECDVDRVLAMLDRLFDNAVRHGPAGVTVTIGTTGGGFFIADDGPGVPEDEYDTVLEAGYSTVQHRPGLGLTVARAIAEAHGWSLSLSGSETGGLRVDVAGVDRVSEAALREDVRA